MVHRDMCTQVVVRQLQFPIVRGDERVLQLMAEVGLKRVHWDMCTRAIVGQKQGPSCRGCS